MRYHAPVQRLYVNIDHVATVRQARRTDEPDPVEAARIAEAHGVDGITAHLREDRRHIQDDDIRRLAVTVTTVLNLEMACTPEMREIALALRPHQVTLVPERREEVTTEGGLDVRRNQAGIRALVQDLNRGGIRTSLFVDPVPETIRACRDCEAAAIELHTGRYAHHPLDAGPLRALGTASELARALGLAVHAGHGLTTANVGPIAAIPEIEELNIGHHIVSRAIMVGLPAAIAEIREEMRRARDAGLSAP